MTTKTPTQPKGAKAIKSAPAVIEATTNADAVVVTQIGDVTQSNAEPISLGLDLIDISPLADLPESHKNVAKVYAEAKGFTQEGATIALHF